MCVWGMQETLWSVVKHNLRKLLLIEKERLTRERFLELVKTSIEIISPKAIRGIIASNRKFLASILQQETRPRRQWQG